MGMSWGSGSGGPESMSQHGASSRAPCDQPIAVRVKFPHQQSGGNQSLSRDEVRLSSLMYGIEQGSGFKSDRIGRW